MTDDTVTAKLAEWEALTEAATEGPWEAVSSEVTMNDRSEWRIGDRSRPQVLRAQVRSADAEFIAAAPTIATALLGFAQEVLELHPPYPTPQKMVYGTITACSECGSVDDAPVEWPCPTVQAARKWIGGEG